MTLNSAVEGKEYVVSDILTDDEEMRKYHAERKTALYPSRMQDTTSTVSWLKL